MSLLNSESIKIIASQSLGEEFLSNDVLSLFAPDVEYRLREIIQEASKFMKHSKRDTLSTEDITNAMRLRKIEQLYGYTSTEPTKYVNNGKEDVFFIEEKIIDLDKILDEPLPEIPRDSSLSIHWLAIDGIQPSIPQNPPAQKSTKSTTKKRKTEDEMMMKTGNTEIKPLVKHILSKEQQIYFEKITELIKGKSENMIKIALDNLREDAGINELLPYFTQFISEEITNNLLDLSLLFNLLKMIESLIESKHLNVEPYLHQLLPSIITCIVAKRLCKEPTEDHWKLRDLSSQILSEICKKYSEQYKSLQPRITKTLLAAFMDPTKPLTTHYGSIKSLSMLGVSVIELLIVPNVHFYFQSLNKSLSSDNPIKKMEAEHVYEALLFACGSYFKESLQFFQNLSTQKDLQQKLLENEIDEKQDNSENITEEGLKEIQSNYKNFITNIFPNILQQYQSLQEIFGEKLSPYISPSLTNYELNLFDHI